MTCKTLLTISILLSLFFSLSAQEKEVPPVYTSSGNPAKISAYEFPMIYAKLGLLNLLHPTSPSLDIGVEYVFHPRFSAELTYGFNTPNLTGKFLEDGILFNPYHKGWATLKYYFFDRNNLPKPRFFTARNKMSYLAIEGYIGSGNTLERNNYALSLDQRIDYLEAEIKKRVYGISIKGGNIWELGPKWELENSIGTGILFMNRKYNILNPVSSPQGFLDLGIWIYDDRRVGRNDYINLIFSLKLNYKIY